MQGEIEHTRKIPLASLVQLVARSNPHRFTQNIILAIILAIYESNLHYQETHLPSCQLNCVPINNRI